MSGTGNGDVDPDDVTLWAGRLRPWPAADAVPPAGPETPAVETPEDGTVIASPTVRRAPVPLPSDADATRRAPGRPELPDDVTALPTRARPGASGRAPSTGAADGVRSVRVPEPGAREIFRPRAEAPVRAGRTAPAPRLPQEPVDIAAAQAAAARRRRRRLVGALVAGVLVAVAIAVGIGILLTLPGS